MADSCQPKAVQSANKLEARAPWWWMAQLFMDALIGQIDVLMVGYAGSATLQMRNGGTVSTNSLVQSSQRQGSSALVEVDGAHSTLRGQSCFFDRVGVSTIRISNGGLINCKQSAILDAGELSLSGTGSKWLSGNSISIGNGPQQNPASVTVNEGTAKEASDAVFLVESAPGIVCSPVLNIEGWPTRGQSSLKE